MRALATLVVAALTLSAATSVDAQNRNAQRVPNFAAVNFRSPGEPQLGIDVAEGIRQRMVRFFPMPPRTLRVLTRLEINNQLAASGFPADSVISTPDLRDLSKTLGIEESMEGAVRRTAAGIEARARFYYGGNINAPEVLPVIVDKNPEAVGRKIAELYVQARKELPAYERCKNALIQNNPDVAIAAATEAMQQYPQGVLPRACMLTAYGAQYKKFPADSSIKLATEIVAIDPDNAIAITELVNAYRAKGDTARAIEMSMKLYSLTPNDLGQATSIIDFLMAAGAPGKALTIVEDQMKQNPGETSILETKWKIFQNENRWKEAVATGEEMVKLDPAKADTTYFRRQVGAAIQDSQPQLAMQFLARAVEKFPKNVFFLQAYQNRLKDQGQVQQALEIAKRVLSLDPKPQAYATVVSLYTQTGQADSAVAFAKQALVGADATTKEQIGTGLLGLIRPAMNKAQADTTAPHEVQKENWAQVLRLSASVDSIVPNANSAFYMSVAAFYVAQHGVANLTEVAKTSRPQACAMLKDATDKLLIVDLNMSRGGRVDSGTASALLQATSAMKPGIDQAKKQLGCR